MDYKEKLRLAKEALESGSYDKDTIEYIFPELKESKSERIKEVAIAFVKASDHFYYHLGISKEEVIAWLEKQGKPLDKPVFDAEDNVMLNAIAEGLCDMVDDFGWSDFGGMPIEDIQNWLKKQGEQKPVDKVEPRFKVGDKVYALRDRFECTIESIDELTYYGDTTNFDIKDQDNWKLVEQKLTAKNIVEIWKDMRLEVYQQASGNRHEPNYSDDSTKMFSLNDIDEIIEKMSEQKLGMKKDFAQKVEPKFKVGDWICNDMCIVRIATIENGMYYFYEGDGLSIVFVDKHYHLWTISDAKEGDVLISQYKKPFIYNGKHDSFCIGSYGGIVTSDIFIVATEKRHWTENVNIHPATKEQCDTLMKAMADAGYTFDFDKKVLKKIEQKPAEWSKEDEARIKQLLGWIDTLKNYIHYDAVVPADLRIERIGKVEKLEFWLKSLKQRMNNV